MGAARITGRTLLAGAAALWMMGVTACSSAGSSIPSATAMPDSTTRPSLSTTLSATDAVPSLRATARSAVEVDLDWTGVTASQQSTGFVLRRDGVDVARLPPSIASFEDVEARPGSKQTYELVVLGAGGVPGVTASATVETPAAWMFEPLDAGATVDPRLLISDLRVITDERRGGVLRTGGDVPAHAEVAVDNWAGIGVALAFKTDTEAGHGVSIIRLDGSLRGIGAVFLTSNGKIGFRNDATGENAVSSIVVPLREWNTVFVRLHTTEPGTEVSVFLNNAPITELSTLLATPTLVRQVQIGDTVDAAALTFDDVTIWEVRSDDA